MRKAIPRTRIMLETARALAIFVLLLVCTSCGSSSETITAPSQLRCAVQAQADSVSFSPDGGAGTLRVATSRECSWSAQSEAAWVTLSAPVTGQGDGSVQFRVAANGDPSSRTGGIRVEDQRLQLAQEGRPCEFRLSTTLETLESAGGDRTVQVTASSAQCRWTAAADVSWITILSLREGVGNGTVSFRVDAVTGPQRIGTITIAGQVVQVEQGTGCSYTVATPAISFGAAGGRGEVPVAAPPGCGWTVQSQAAWITVMGGSTGTGSSVVTFHVESTDGPARTGTLTVAGQVVTITQSPGCAYILEPAAYAAPAAGGASAVTVRAGPGCGWNASSASEWITITAGQGGNGSGEVRFTVAANAGPGRNGGLRIADQVLSVTQSSGCSFTLNPSTVSVVAAPSTGVIQVSTAQGCTWSATSAAPWITIPQGSSGSGNGQVQFAAAANAGPAREGSLSIGGRSVTVTQASGCTYSITPTAQDVGGLGGTGSSSIATAAGCPWVASSNVEWMTVNARSGSGPGQVPFTVAPNLSPARTGTLTLAGHVFTVNQESQCTWVFVPASHAYTATGGNGAILVIVSGPCTWTAASDVGWITLTSGASGTGGGLVQFVVAPNGGSARTGSLTIAGRRYEVTQGGQ